MSTEQIPINKESDKALKKLFQKSCTVFKTVEGSCRYYCILHHDSLQYLPKDLQYLPKNGLFFLNLKVEVCIFPVHITYFASACNIFPKLNYLTPENVFLKGLPFFPSLFSTQTPSQWVKTEVTKPKCSSNGGGYIRSIKSVVTWFAMRVRRKRKGCVCARGSNSLDNDGRRIAAPALPCTPQNMPAFIPSSSFPLSSPRGQHIYKRWESEYFAKWYLSMTLGF